MDAIETLTRKAQKTKHGFTPIRREAESVVAGHSARESLNIASRLLTAEAHQARMLAAFILGLIAAQSKAALNTLKRKVSADPDWRVQEILAQAFDHYCSDVGYENALPIIMEWLNDRRPNVRRGVTEGLRIWTSRDYFRDQPQTAIRLLSRLRADDSEYVRRSVGNALRDISRKHPESLQAELKTWNLSDRRVEQTYKLASKFLR